MIVITFGTRPEIIKLYPLIEIFKNHKFIKIFQKEQKPLFPYTLLVNLVT